MICLESIGGFAESSVGQTIEMLNLSARVLGCRILTELLDFEVKRQL